MSRKQTRQLTRQRPDLAGMVNMAKGVESAAMALADAKQEEGVVSSSGGLMIQKFRIGKRYYIETPNWVYIGRCSEVGIDYITLSDCIRVHIDGRHALMMTVGEAQGMEVEITGSTSEQNVVFPIDYVGPWCEWEHDIPRQTPALPAAETPRRTRRR